MSGTVLACQLTRKKGTTTAAYQDRILVSESKASFVLEEEMRLELEENDVDIFDDKDNDLVVELKLTCIPVDGLSSSSSKKKKKLCSFLFGGLEIISNARSIETFVVVEEKDEEELLFTSRGLKTTSDDGRQLYRCIIMARGGPTEVIAIKLKLKNMKLLENDWDNCHGLANTNNNVLSLVTVLKFKGRLPESVTVEEEEDDDTTAANNNNTGDDTHVSEKKCCENQKLSLVSEIKNTKSLSETTRRSYAPSYNDNNNNNNNNGYATQSDIGAAISTLHATSKNMEDNILRHISSGIQTTNNKMMVIETKSDVLLTYLEAQHKAMLEQGRVINFLKESLVSQNDIIQNQQKQIDSILLLLSSSSSSTSKINSQSSNYCTTSTTEIDVINEKDDRYCANDDDDDDSSR